MKFAFKQILVILTLGASLSAIAKDTVVMKNGDILSGEILRETDENVILRSSAFGAVSLQTKDIAEVRFETEAHGEIVTKPETPDTAEPAPEAAPSLAAGSKPAPEPTQPRPQQPEPELKSKWSGQAGLSLAMRESVKSNASGVTGTDKNETYRFYGNLGWESNRNKLSWNWTYRYSRDEYEKQDDFFNLTQQYTHDFKQDYYATAKTMYQRDYRRNIENEYLQTAEIGVRWFSQPKFEFSTSAGGGYHQYERLAYNSASQSDRELQITQPKFIFDESMRWQIIQSLTLLQRYTHLGDLTDYHFVFTTGLENKLIHDIFLRLEYRLDRDTEVYYDDRGYYDKALLTSLHYKF